MSCQGNVKIEIFQDNMTIDTSQENMKNLRHLKSYSYLFFGGAGYLESISVRAFLVVAKMVNKDRHTIHCLPCWVGVLRDYRIARKSIHPT